MKLDDILNEGRQYVQQGDFQKAIYYYRYARKDLSNAIDREILDEAIDQIERLLNKETKKQTKQQSKTTKQKTKPHSPPRQSGFPVTLILLLIILALSTIILYGGFYPTPKKLQVKNKVEETVDNLKKMAELPEISSMPKLPEILTKTDTINKATKIADEGDKFFVQQQYGLAESKYQESLDVFMLPATQVNLAAVYLRQNKMDEAEQILTQTLGLLKDNKWLDANPEITLDRTDALSKIYINLAYLHSKRIGQFDAYGIARSNLDEMVKQLKVNYDYAKAFMDNAAMAKQYDPSFNPQTGLSLKNLMEVKRDMVLSVRAVLLQDAKKQFPGRLKTLEDLIELKDMLPTDEQQKSIQLWEKAYMVDHLLKRIQRGVD